MCEILKRFPPGNCLCGKVLLESRSVVSTKVMYPKSITQLAFLLTYITVPLANLTNLSAKDSTGEMQNDGYLDMQDFADLKLYWHGMINGLHYHRVISIDENHNPIAVDFTNRTSEIHGK